MKSAWSMSASSAAQSVMSASAPASASAPTVGYQYWITSYALVPDCTSSVTFDWIWSYGTTSAVTSTSWVFSNSSSRILPAPSCGAAMSTLSVPAPSSSDADPEHPATTITPAVTADAAIRR